MELIKPEGLLPPVGEQLKHSVFCDLWERGYYLTSGLKYGGDFLVYSADPSHTHSLYIAIIVPWKQPITSMVSLCRVGTKVKKTILLCSVDESQQFKYYTLKWTAMTK